MMKRIGKLLYTCGVLGALLTGVRTLTAQSEALARPQDCSYCVFNPDGSGICYYIICYE